MTRRSRKQLVMRRLEDITAAAVKHTIRNKLFGLPVSIIEDFILFVDGVRKQVESNRYLSRGLQRKKDPKFDFYLDRDHDFALADREFRFHFRMMCRDSFWKLVAQIENDPAFAKGQKGPTGKPPAHQLLVLLKCYGTEGNQSSSDALGNLFGVSSGSINNFRDTAHEALLSLEDCTYSWPTALERRAIADRIEAKHLWPDCVGLINSTLLLLGSRPLLHGENDLSRKKFYALIMLVVCDDQTRITYYHVGWPGSVHDNRVWRNCRLATNPSDYFSLNKYLLGDSAFTAGPTMIPPFKSLPGKGIASNETEFNTLLAKPRVKSEHCIGTLKGCFPFFRSIRMKQIR